MVTTVEIIKNSHLVFVDSSKPGIYRKGKPGHFTYEDIKGNKIKDQRNLDRIQKLVLPPAWREVWISPKENGHLQAIGIDEAGRKQYRYHESWTSRRSHYKYFKLLEFGKALPRARRQIAKDLRRKKLDEKKVLAICLKVLQETLIRVGNGVYEKAYKSYGLSTLKDKHLRQEENNSALCFVGKKGIRQEIALKDKSLIKLLKKCKEIPGQELFQFYTPEGLHKAVDSGMINNYIREIMGADFTAKDFRTWGGTLEALNQLAKCMEKNPDGPKIKVVGLALDAVAAKLGNTRMVCKKAYVYPLLLETFENDKLDKYLKKLSTDSTKGKSNLYEDEKVLLRFLGDMNRKKNTALAQC
jgi:DNA topoisomerase I